MSTIDTLLQARATLASPALTGTPTAPTPATADNTTKIATTAYVKAQGYVTSSPVSSVFGRTGVVVATSGDYSVAQITGAAPLASPTFTGTPVAPTPATADNSTTVATTAFVKAQGYLTSNAVASVFGRTGAVVAASGDYLASQVTNAADKLSASEQDFNAAVFAPNLVGGSAVTALAGTGSYTPIVDQEQAVHINYTGVSAGTITINNPGHFPAAGKSLLFSVTVQSSGAAVSMAWGNAYKFGGWSSSPGIGSGQSYTWIFIMVGDLSAAICIGTSNGVWA